MTRSLHHAPRLRRLIARILSAVLLLQVMIPAGLAPPRAALAGADGSVLPLLFCMVGQDRQAGRADGQPGPHAPEHCLFCRLPGVASLGIGAVPEQALPARRAWIQVRHATRARPSPAMAPRLGFAARAPPPFLVA